MKKKKILAFMILSWVVIIITIIVSYVLESRSQKLPAVISSDKVLVSSEVNGILLKYDVSSMQQVSPNDLLAEVVNTNLDFKLQTLKNEKRKYEELISSARSGDYLKKELFELDEDIQKNTTTLENARLNIEKLSQKLALMEALYDSAKKKYDASKRLYDSGILNNSDFEKAARDFWNIHDDYYELKGDSLVASETVKTSSNIINLLKARQNILSSNVDILASDYLIDLNKIEADIKDAEEEIKNLKIYSPITGVVTDINYLPGEKIDKGDVIAEIADLSHVWLTAFGSSVSRRKVQIGQKVCVYGSSNKKVWGRVVTVSPVMEKVKALSSTFETVNTYAKIEVKFDNMVEALKYITPGERLFVRIYYY
jgi:multidrug resistance efflux pump